jgi:hypothetical protein
MAMSPRLLRPLATGFNPRSIAGLSGWWDADDASTITLNSTTVSEWRDKSGNGRHATQATAANQPTYSTGEVNGRAALTMDAARTMEVSAWDFKDEATVFFVFKQSGGTNGCIFQRGGVNAAHAVLLEGIAPNLPVRARHFDSKDSLSATVSQNVYRAGMALFTGLTSQIFINGTSSAASAAGATREGNSFAMRMFGLSATVYRLNGGVAEILYYDRALSVAERLKINTYLSKKYNITIA